jgi:CRP-like cAMP-binding protein
LPKLSHFKRHEPLHFRSHGLWRIHSGYVRTLTWNVEGESVPLGFWTAGDVVGQAIAQTHPYETKCLSAVEAEYLGAQHSPAQASMIAQVRQSHDLLRIAHCRQAELRLLQFVCWLAQRFGRLGAEGYSVEITLTHQEIAESIGITRVTVTRLLKSLAREGKLKWTSREKLVYPKTFRQFCEGSDKTLPH